MTDKPVVIAIDGPAASGKGTLARLIAEHKGYAHLDTGRLYRYVGWRVLQSGGDPEDQTAALAAAEGLRDIVDLSLLSDRALSSDEAGQAASKVAAIPAVRTALLCFQKDFAAHPPGSAPGAVLDGRDIGTVICPDSPLKFFVTADTEIRAKRRFKELQSQGISVTYDAVLADMR
ncbi:MAG: (d)CMP kinase, partial [Alphaproteobacteria bacterium]|nr:(d)CMP kinase [Alphaproteobacteria bacterium]